MIYDSKPSYDAISIPTKSTNTFDKLTRNVLTTIFAVLTFVATGYFLYSGFFVVNSGSVSRIRLSSEPIIIEFDMDDASDSLVPLSESWLKFHDELLENAGYDAAELNANPSVDVSFIAYDPPIEAQVIGGSNQNRPSRGITCYTKYSVRGNTNAQKCLGAGKIVNSIRTGCSSLNFKSELSGVITVGTTGCESPNPKDMVTARCCQPTPGTEFENAAWVVTTPEVTNKTTPCAAVGCVGNQDLVGCYGKVAGAPIGGVQNDGNKCRAQRGAAPYDVEADESAAPMQPDSGSSSELLVGALCADQPQDGHTLKCQKTESLSAALNDDGKYVSSVQCDQGAVMFDCNSFLRGPIDSCAALSANGHKLFGENYRLVRRRSKIYCDAFGDSQAVRAGATCCELS